MEDLFASWPTASIDSVENKHHWIDPILFPFLPYFSDFAISAIMCDCNIPLCNIHDFMYDPTNINLLTHCYQPNKGNWDPNVYICQSCKRMGLDCFKGCPECNKSQILLDLKGLAKVKNNEGEYFSRIILCKPCSQYHLIHNVGQQLFNTRVCTSHLYPDIEATDPKGMAGKLAWEDEKELPLGFHICEVELCTVCRIKSLDSGWCNDCDKENEAIKAERLQVINGHLVITRTYCQWHALYPKAVQIGPSCTYSTFYFGAKETESAAWGAKFATRKWGNIICTIL